DKAKEVPDFYTYYNSTVAGGTRVESAYRLVNEIVETENLTQDYNIYIFHGTDGDDWDMNGKQTIPELEKMLTYSNRIGITIAARASGPASNSAVETYVKDSSLLNDFPERLRLDAVSANASEERLIEGIRRLLS
ncbi:MAG: DUF444 family protein, partial [Thermodesulfobacteriota bacterium]|nr:DUF444 family protein [Thermodesulfobacteriota bacterium]